MARRQARGMPAEWKRVKSTGARRATSPLQSTNLLTNFAPLGLNLGPWPNGLLNDHRQMRAPVHRATRGCAVVANRALLTVADGAETAGCDAPAHQVLAHGVRSAFAERQVVF